MSRPTPSSSRRGAQDQSHSVSQASQESARALCERPPAHACDSEPQEQDGPLEVVEEAHVTPQIRILLRPCGDNKVTHDFGKRASFRLLLTQVKTRSLAAV